MTLEGALSSYDIPSQTSPDTSMPCWLSTCISEAAKHLDQAPFLQLLISSGTQAFERHRVTTAVVQVWRVLACLHNACKCWGPPPLYILICQVPPPPPRPL